jgi:hypothetical protein
MKTSNGERYLCHRAKTAFRAISFRRSGESFLARAMPPFEAPSFASATAAGFFFCFCCLLTMREKKSGKALLVNTVLV